MATSRARWVIGIAVAVGTAVALAGPPVGAHVTKKVKHTWKHLRPLADQRYALKGAPATDVACAGCIGENELGFDPATQAELNSAVTVEAWREVGAPGQPGFITDALNCDGPNDQCWDNFDSVHNSVAFFRDPFGVVHLKGLGKCFNANDCVGGGIGRAHTIFVLPSGYRPAKREVQATLSNAGSFRVNIESGGEVRIEELITFQTGWVSLDGITFRAA